jgi:hypothetical protein
MLFGLTYATKQAKANKKNRKKKLHNNQSSSTIVKPHG